MEEEQSAAAASRSDRHPDHTCGANHCTQEGRPHVRGAEDQGRPFASLIPLGFVIGFIAYAADKTTVSAFLLTAIAVMGAAVPFTVVIFAVSRRRDRSDRPSS